MRGPEGVWGAVLTRGPGAVEMVVVWPGGEEVVFVVVVVAGVDAVVEQVGGAVGFTGVDQGASQGCRGRSRVRPAPRRGAPYGWSSAPTDLIISRCRRV